MSFKIIKNIITKKKEEDECANSLPGETLAEYNIPEENVEMRKMLKCPQLYSLRLNREKSYRRIE